MRVKDYLKGPKRLDILIKQKQEEIESLRRSMTSIKSIEITDERVQGGRICQDARFTEQLARLDEMEREYALELQRCIKLKHDIIGQIQLLDNDIYVEVLYKRYVEFKKLEQIGLELNYSYTRIRHIHGYALLAFENKFFNS